MHTNTSESPQNKNISKRTCQNLFIKIELDLRFNKCHLAINKLNRFKFRGISIIIFRYTNNTYMALTKEK